MFRSAGATIIGAIALAALSLTACSSGPAPTSVAPPTCGPGTQISRAPAPSPPSRRRHPAMPLHSIRRPHHRDSSPPDTSNATSCGSALLHYLQTGDNGGNPYYDQHYAADVDDPLPQARAVTDKAIDDCNTGYDTNAARATAAEQASTSAAHAAAAATTAAAQAAAEADRQLARQKQACAAITGRYNDTYQWCSSTVVGNPSGRAGADCTNAQATFDGDGINQSDLKNTLDFYPGCFPS